MPGDDIAKELLATAKSDAHALEHMLDVECFDDRVFGFHAQQAVEKALKAWLNILGFSHPFTHDLSRLLYELEQRGADVAPYWDFLDLSSFAVRFRYESLPLGDDPLDRSALLGNVQELIHFVSQLIAEYSGS